MPGCVIARWRRRANPASRKPEYGAARVSDLLERVWLLKQAPLFADVETEDLQMVAQELDEETCVAGERLFDRGDAGDRAYFIVHGRIGMSVHANPSAGGFIATLGERECFGELCLLDDRPRAASAHVVQDATLLALDRHKFRALIERSPALALGVLRGYGARLRATVTGAS